MSWGGTLKYWKIVGVGMFVALSVSARAQTSTDPATAGVAAPPSSDVSTDASGQDNSNQLICHEERVTGTLFPSRVCHTKRQWDVMRQRSQELLRGAQQNSGFGNRPLGANGN
jgi:hypothetical protein